MRQYFMLVLGVCLTAGVIRVIAPEGGMKKHVEMVCSLCLAAAVAVPLVSAVLGFDESTVDGIADGIFGEYETQDLEAIYNSYIVEKNTEAVEDALAEELCKELCADRGDLSVKVAVSLENGECRVEGVCVILEMSGVLFDPDIIKNTVFDRLGVECEIIYNIFDE